MSNFEDIWSPFKLLCLNEAHHKAATLNSGHWIGVGASVLNGCAKNITQVQSGCECSRVYVPTLDTIQLERSIEIFFIGASICNKRVINTNIGFYYSRWSLRGEIINRFRRYYEDIHVNKNRSTLIYYCVIIVKVKTSKIPTLVLIFCLLQCKLHEKKFNTTAAILHQVRRVVN